MSCIVAKYPSKLFLPPTKKTYPTILNFLTTRFPKVAEKEWIKRISKGLIVKENGKPITVETKYTPYTTLLYYKTADTEIQIPFKEKIIYMDNNIIVVDKPHFLPVMPAGKYINENLLTRLKKRTNNSDIVPINRIDRETSGLVIFSVNKNTRGIYQSLFMHKKVEKTYYAITRSGGIHFLPQDQFLIQSRIVKGRPWFTMKQTSGRINAQSFLTPIQRKKDKILFKIKPLTGKKHQIRIHLSSIGCKIINDRTYPDLLPEKTPDFQNPLKLQSQALKFNDPVTGKLLQFQLFNHLSL